MHRFKTSAIPWHVSRTPALLAAIGLALCGGNMAMAQVAPDAGRLLDTQKAPVVIDPPSRNISVDNATPARKLGVTTGPGPKVSVTGYRISGLSMPLKADAGSLLAKYVGPDRSFDDLESAAEALQVAIRQQGLFLAQAYIPEQKLEGGMVEIRVLEGRLDVVELEPLPEGLPVGKAQIDAILANLQPGQLLTVDSLERTLFLLSDLRGINVKSVIKAGARPGTAKLNVAVTAGDKYEKNVDIDNYGSTYTGDFRVSGSFGVNSLIGRGDLLKVTANASTSGGLKFLRAAYQTPVGGSGLKLGAAVSALKYSLGGSAFGPLQASGDATVYSLFSLYPLVRSRNFNTFAQANYDRRNFHDAQKTLAIDNFKHSDVLTLGLVGDSRDQMLGGGINNFSLGLTTGKLTLDTPVALAADQAATGRQTNGSFSKLGYGLGRQQLLWAKSDNSSDRLVVYVSLQGQIARKNLDTSEKFSLGGPAGVRGYAGGEATGDSGNLLSWELRKNIVDEKIKGDFVISLFGDYGRVRVNRNPLATDLVNNVSLVSHGIGLAWAIPDSFLLRASIAWRGSYVPVADPDPRRARIYVSFSKTL